MPGIKQGQKGGLLVDWSTALSFAATAAMFAVPGLKTFVHESQRSAVVNTLQLEIRRAARSANESGKVIALCARSYGGSDCASDANWSRGWIAYLDGNDNGEREPEERLLWSTTNGHANIVVAAQPAVLSFRPFYARPYAGSTTGRLTVCDRAGSGGLRRVEIDRAGTPRLGEAHSGGCDG